MLRFYLILAIIAILNWSTMSQAQTLVGELQTYCSTDSKEASNAYNSGLKAERADDLETAIAFYNEAIQFDPGYCDAMDNLGRLYRTQNQYDKAEALYKRSIEIHGENLVAHMNLGVIYWLQGDYEGAIRQYKAVIKIDPTNPEGYYGIGSVYNNINKPKEAIPYLERSEELYVKSSSPHVDDARGMLSIAYAQIGNCKEAIAWAEKLAPTHRKQDTYNAIQSACAPKR